jgi:hypothetical protein
MDENQLKRLRAAPPAPQVIGPDDGHDRTLLYGYDVDRRTFHVYQKGGELHLVVYESAYAGHEAVVRRYEHGPTLDIAAVVPNKRLYSEACDADFCEQLVRRGMTVPLLDYNPKREPKQFHGLVVEGEPTLSMAV